MLRFRPGPLIFCVEAVPTVDAPLAALPSISDRASAQRVVAPRRPGGERSGQAFALSNVGELRFFAFFAEAPLIVPDDATRAMLCDQGYTVRSAAG